MLKAILFDWDGTLYNSLPNIEKAYNETGKRINLSHYPYENFRHLIGIPTIKQGEIILPSEPELFVEIYRQEYVKLPKAGLYENAKTSISVLAEMGFNIVLVTSKTRKSALENLKDHGLYDLFDLFICGDEVCNPKPDPEPITKALEMLQISSEEAIYVGDSAQDIIASKGAGVRVIGVTWGAKLKKEIKDEKPDFIADSFEELIKIILSL